MYHSYRRLILIYLHFPENLLSSTNFSIANRKTNKIHKFTTINISLLKTFISNGIFTYSNRVANTEITKIFTLNGQMYAECAVYSWTYTSYFCGRIENSSPVGIWNNPYNRKDYMTFDKKGQLHGYAKLISFTTDPGPLNNPKKYYIHGIEHTSPADVIKNIILLPPATMYYPS